MFTSLLLLSFCTLSLANNGPSTKNLSLKLPQAPATASPKTFSANQWDEAYSNFIRKRITNYPEFMNMPASHVGRLCSNWADLSADDRKEFWVMFIKSISYAESSWRRGTMTLETASNLKSDMLTKKYVVSEGLMQISYGSAWLYDVEYGSASCNFPLKNQQKDLFYDDVQDLKDNHVREQISENLNRRDILNPIRNIACALDIMYVNYFRVKEESPTESLRKGVAKYWATLRTSRDDFEHFTEEFTKENNAKQHLCQFDF